MNDDALVNTLALTAFHFRLSPNPCEAWSSAASLNHIGFTFFHTLLRK